ncbi:MAG: CoA transferase [Candidatus Nanopelagicaceae bacterium]|nr:CoA transferase [Candidatus Nanopelagicaceae bacterium]
MSALAGLRVIDCATLFAGPTASLLLGDFGAEVIKIEHPESGDPVRNHGYKKNDQSLWWTYISRNKKTLALNLGNSKGAEVFRKLIENTDVLIENFRPGTLEKWGLAPEELHKVNPRLIIARVTGFGQAGPYSRRPGFGTLAEAMSGFANLTGTPDGPPTLPAFGLADAIAGITTAQAVMTALFALNNSNSEAFGKGQVIDTSLLEPIMSTLGPQSLIFDQLGIKQKRTGNRTENNAPRNTYKAKDGKWLAISTSAPSIAARVMTLVGHPEVINEPWFQEARSRVAHADQLDTYINQWISQRDSVEVIAAFTEAEAAVAPIYDIEDLLIDPQIQARETITRVNDPLLGEVAMQNVIYQMSKTPGQINFTGRPKGADTREILEKFASLSPDEIIELHKAGVVFDANA